MEEDFEKLLKRTDIDTLRTEGTSLEDIDELIVRLKKEINRAECAIERIYDHAGRFWLDHDERCLNYQHDVVHRCRVRIGQLEVLKNEIKGQKKNSKISIVIH